MKKKQQPDMIAQVGEMLQRIAVGNWSVPALGNVVSDGAMESEQALEIDCTIVLASAMLAIAGELREINNSLVRLVEDNVLIVSEALPLNGDGVP